MLELATKPGLWVAVLLIETLAGEAIVPVVQAAIEVVGRVG